METDIKLCPDEVCRACLSKSTNMRLLTTKIEGENRTLLEVLMFVANLDVKIGDKLPTQVCNECEEIMYKADAFKRRCIESETYLNVHVNKENIDHYELEILEKPLIKAEVTFKKPKSSKGNTKKSITKVKTFKADMEFKEEKNQFSDVPMCSSDLPNTETSIENNKEQPVKEEFNDGFDSDMDFDVPLTEFKQESAINELKLYSCTCGSVFDKNDEYQSHLKTKNCNGYKKTMKIKMEKKNSLGGRNITIKRKIMCPDCNLEFDTIKACKLHQRKHGADEETGLFECTYCMRKFNRKSSYTTHINHHEEKSKVKYICDVCKREFQHKAHLDNHVVAVHSRDKGFTCDICQMKFSTQESLEIHKDSHKTEKKHQCKICQKAFYMLSTLNDHMRTHTGERPFLCSVCGRGFSQKTNLAQHMRRHQGLKPFKCEDCDRRFVSKGELVAHTRKHSGAHPFVCDECGSGFTTSSSLVKHRRIHTGERPYACDLCPMRFAASGTLKNHRRTHTGEKPFHCSYCDKAFVQRQDLVSHIRCHTGERPYTCGCGQAFRKAASLKAHVKAHGREGALHGLLATPLVSHQT